MEERCDEPAWAHSRTLIISSQKEVCIMSDPVQTSSDSLCKLVSWAHSHGTICSLIPSLQHLTNGSHGTVLTIEPGLHGSSVPVAVWGCGAGHAYHWPLSDHSTAYGGSGITSHGQERFVGGRPSNKVTVRASCDLSYSEAASQREEFNSQLFDIAGCISSATDEDDDYEPRPSRKRGGAAGGALPVKKVKQEANSTEDYDSGIGLAVKDIGSQASWETNTTSQITHTLLPIKTQHGHTVGCEEVVDSGMQLMGGGSCMTGTTEQTRRCSSTEKIPDTHLSRGLERPAKTGPVDFYAWDQDELGKLQAILTEERSRIQQMTEIISSLKHDKELLQHELTKKSELICDFLQDKLRPEKRSSLMPSSDDVAGVDSPTLFDSFEEMELHPLDHQRTLKSKRSRDGENTRVRMKNVVGVIARYMAALQEFRRSVSMKVAFDRVGVDRNTISRTASIAELSLAAPDVFHALASWDEKEETLAHYAHRCQQAMDENIKAKIKMMKSKGELLPIVSKSYSLTPN
ncbi:hypothetical protein PBY51_023348 [Eleginops maclovinus]|uniref:Coiled-coil domain-containing protein 106 n=1 Tax=Eleginops maclovinus TaxID=56733 RepID=A0AAN7WY72_ELEMC|nr:hypothetical protein PBY51_023348 [Eleginops maclovinus]